MAIHYYYNQNKPEACDVQLKVVKHYIKGLDKVIRNGEYPLYYFHTEGDLRPQEFSGWLNQLNRYMKSEKIKSVSIEIFSDNNSEQIHRELLKLAMSGVDYHVY